MKLVTSLMISAVVVLLLVHAAEAEINWLPRWTRPAAATSPSGEPNAHVAPGKQSSTHLLGTGKRSSLRLRPTSVSAQAVPYTSHSPESFTHPTERSTLDQCGFDQPDPWAGYCQESKGKKSSCGCGIFRGRHFGRCGGCGNTSSRCGGCLAHTPRSADHHAHHTEHDHSGDFDLSARSGHDRHADRHRTDHPVRVSTPQPQPLPLTAARSLPRNSLPINSSRRSLENHLPTTNDDAHRRDTAVDLYSHDASDDGHIHDAASESEDRCRRPCGPDLFFHFLGRRCPADDCEVCDGHSQDVTTNASDSDDAALSAPT